MSWKSQVSRYHSNERCCRAYPSRNSQMYTDSCDTLASLTVESLTILLSVVQAIEMLTKLGGESVGTIQCTNTSAGSERIVREEGRSVQTDQLSILDNNEDIPLAGSVFLLMA